MCEDNICSAYIFVRTILIFSKNCRNQILPHWPHIISRVNTEQVENRGNSAWPEIKLPTARRIQDSLFDTLFQHHVFEQSSRNQCAEKLLTLQMLVFDAFMSQFYFGQYLPRCNLRLNSEVGALPTYSYVPNGFCYTYQWQQLSFSNSVKALLVECNASSVNLG